jgi:xylulokinase
MGHLLGIDVGTSASKAVLCNARGKVLGSGSGEHPSSHPRPGWSEQSPEDWWKSARKSVREALKSANVDGKSVSAIGLTGQMHGSVLLDSAGKPLRPAILWNDQRTAEQCAWIENRLGGRARVIERVGNPALTGFTAPKLLWVRENERKTWDSVKKLLLPKDYLRLKLTGEHSTDVADASGTLLLDVCKRDWSAEMLERLELERSLLPRVQESTQISGVLTASSAKALGLRPGVPVIAGAGDQPAGAVGVGLVKPGIIGASIGTSGVIFSATDQPLFDPEGRIHTMCHAIPGAWCVFGCMLSAGASLQWFRNQLADKELRWLRKHPRRARGRSAYDLLAEAAQRADPGCGGVFFLPYLSGERCPFSDPEARGGWVGVNLSTSRNQLLRSIFEGVSYNLGEILDLLRALGLEVDHIRATGGGAKSVFWRQLLADVFGATVRTTRSDEGPAFGAALLAGVGTGVWPTVHEACAKAVKLAETSKPAPGAVDIYRDLRKTFVEQRLRFLGAGSESHRSSDRA